MPQMAPTLWLFLLFNLFLLVTLFNSFIYFKSTLTSKTQSMGSLKSSKKNWLW